MSNGVSGIKERKGNPWVMLVLAYVAALSAPLNMIKVPAVSVAVMSAFGIEADGIGFLMSVYTLTGVIFALPASAVARKFGYKVAGSSALIISLIGAIAGCFTTDFAMLMVTRVLEGIGLCMLNIILISTAFAWFPPEKRGVAVGIGSTNVALASFAGMITLAAIGDMFGYMATWQVAATFTAVATVLFVAFYKNPEFTVEEQETRSVSMFKAIGQHRTILLLFVLFTLHNLCIVGVLNNFASAYIVTNFGVSMTEGSLFMAGAAASTVVFMIVVGKLTDVARARKPFLVAGSICGIILAVGYFAVPNLVIVGLFSVLIGIESACIVSIAQTSGPEILGSKELAPVSSSLLTFGQNLGQFVGPSVFGIMVVGMGYTTAGWALMIPCFVVNLIVSLVIKVK